MSKRPQPGNAPSSSVPQSSIGRKYTGVAAYNELIEADIARTAEFKVRGELAKRTIEELRKGGEPAGQAETLEAAHSLLKTTRDVTDDVGELTEEMLGLKVVFDDLKRTIEEVQERSPIVMNEKRTALLNTFEELRNTYAQVMNQDSAVTIYEIQLLRTANADLTSQVDLLRSQEETLKSLLVTTYQTRAPAANSIEGIELPEWFPRDSDKPFEVIDEALRNLGQVNDKLRTKCLHLQRAGDEKSHEINDLKLEIAGLTARMTAMGDIGGREAATLKADVAQAKAQREREHQHVLNARKVREEQAMKSLNLENQISKLQRQCIRISDENSKLKLEAASKKTHQASIDAVREEANLRIEGYRSREKSFIAQIETTANERVRRAESEAAAALKQVKELQNSTNLSSTILDQYKIRQEDLVEKAQQAEERASKAEADKQNADQVQNHLLNIQSDIMNAKTVADTKAHELGLELKTAKKIISLLEGQKAKMDETIRQKDKVWHDDKALGAQLEEELRGTKEDLEFAVKQTTQYKNAWEESKRQAEVDLQMLEDAALE